MDVDEDGNASFAIACQQSGDTVNTVSESNSGSGIILFLGIAVGIGGELKIVFLALPLI